MNETKDRCRLEEMREVAFRLGMAFGQEAERADDIDRKLKLSDAFHQCFASVRLSIALDLRLRKTPAEAVARERPEALDREPLETERPERLDYTERDRDRETERASFPLLLRKLTQVADAAEELLPQAAELPTLREILAKAKATPGPRAIIPPPQGEGDREAVEGASAPRASAPAHYALRTPPPRRATGPP